MPERSTSFTSAISSSRISGEASGMKAVLFSVCIINSFNDVYHFQPLQRIGSNGSPSLQHIHYVVDNIMMVLRRTFISAVIIPGVGWIEFGHAIILHMAIFHLIHILTTDLDASILGNDGHAALQVLIPHRC